MKPKRQRKAALHRVLDRPVRRLPEMIASLRNRDGTPHYCVVNDTIAWCSFVAVKMTKLRKGTDFARVYGGIKEELMNLGDLQSKAL